MFNPNNVCMFEGRISNDPTYSTIGSGQNQFEKALFNIAVQRQLTKDQRDKAKQDSSIKTADFIPCSLIGSGVKILRDYFGKGKAIKVCGSYQEYVTTDSQTGNKKYGHIFTVDSISFTTQDSQGSSSNNGNSNSQPASRPAQNSAPSQIESGFANMFDEEDNPF